MDLIAIKVTAASIAFALAILQALTMLQLYGKATIFPFGTRALQRWHRRQGDVILILILYVAYHCVTKASIDPDQPRVLAHAIFGGLAVLLVLTKFTVVQWAHRGMAYITYLGISLFVAAMGATTTTIAWYFYMWFVRGIRPSY